MLQATSSHTDSQSRLHWEVDATGQASVWSRGECNFEEAMEKSELGFCTGKVNGLHVYSCCACLDTGGKVLERNRDWR